MTSASQIEQFNITAIGREMWRQMGRDKSFGIRYDYDALKVSIKHAVEVNDLTLLNSTPQLKRLYQNALQALTHEEAIVFLGND